MTTSVSFGGSHCRCAIPHGVSSATLTAITSHASPSLMSRLSAEGDMVALGLKGERSGAVCSERALEAVPRHGSGGGPATSAGSVQHQPIVVDDAVEQLILEDSLGSECADERGDEEGRESRGCAHGHRCRGENR